jgi:hypothetical protein
MGELRLVTIGGARTVERSTYVCETWLGSCQDKRAGMVVGDSCREK